MAYPPLREALTDPKTGIITRPWGLFVQDINNFITNIDNSLRTAITNQLPGVMDSLAAQSGGIATIENGERWLKGPWLFGQDGLLDSAAVIRPPTLTGDVSNYAPAGIDTCVGIELGSDRAVSIRGLRQFANVRRLLYILNHGSFTVSFPHEDVSSDPAFRIGLAAAGDILALPGGAAMWLQYDIFSQRWRLFAIPSIAVTNWPVSMQSSNAPLAVLAGRQWMGFNAAGASIAFRAVGYASTEPTVSFPAGGSRLDNQTDGNYNEYDSNAAGVGVVIACELTTAQQRHQPIYQWVFRTGPDISSMRMWQQIYDTDPAFSGAVGNFDDTLTARQIGLRYSSGVSANFQLCSRAIAGAGNQVVEDTGVAVQADTRYKIRLTILSTGAGRVTINDAGQTDVVSGPVAAANLGMTMNWYNNSGAGVRSVALRSHWCEFGTAV